MAISRAFTKRAWDALFVEGINYFFVKPSSLRKSAATFFGCCLSRLTREFSSCMTFSVSGFWTARITFSPFGPSFSIADLRTPSEML